MAKPNGKDHQPARGKPYGGENANPRQYQPTADEHKVPVVGLLEILALEAAPSLRLIPGWRHDGQIPHGTGSPRCSRSSRPRDNQRMSALFVVDLRRVGRHDLALAGGKGANLGELIRAGFPVPPGFVVTTAAYDRFVAQNHLEETSAR